MRVSKLYGRRTNGRRCARAGAAGRPKPAEPRAGGRVRPVPEPHGRVPPARARAGGAVPAARIASRAWFISQGFCGSAAYLECTSGAERVVRCLLGAGSLVLQIGVSRSACPTSVPRSTSRTFSSPGFAGASVRSDTGAGLSYHGAIGQPPLCACRLPRGLFPFRGQAPRLLGAALVWDASIGPATVASYCTVNERGRLMAPARRQAPFMAQALYFAGRNRGAPSHQNLVNACKQGSPSTEDTMH